MAQQLRDPLEDALAEADAILQSSAPDPLEAALADADTVLAATSMSPLEQQVVTGFRAQQRPPVPAPIPSPLTPPPTGRPAPFHVEGVTDPGSVRVTAPPHVEGALVPGSTRVTPPAPKPAPPVAPRGVNPKTGTVLRDIPPGQHLLDPLAELWHPVQGAQQAGRGVMGLARAAVSPPGGREVTRVIPETGERIPSRLPSDSTLAAASDVVEGAFEVGKPLLIPAAAAAPLPTAVALTAGAVAGDATRQAVLKMGGSEEQARLASNLAAAAVVPPAAIGTRAATREAGRLAHEFRMSGLEPEVPGPRALLEPPVAARGAQPPAVAPSPTGPVAPQTMAVADLLKLAKISPEKMNQYRGPEIEALTSDIRANGIQTPITVRIDPQTGEPVSIDNGHHRLTVAQNLGMTDVPVRLSNDPSFADISAQLRGTDPVLETAVQGALETALQQADEVLTQEQRNAQHLEQQAADLPVRNDVTAMESGRQLERRLQTGVSPTGEERRAEAPVSVSTEAPAAPAVPAPPDGAAPAPVPAAPAAGPVPPAGVKPAPPVAPKQQPAIEVLRAALPELGFTLSTDADTIYRSLQREVLQRLRRSNPGLKLTPTKEEMRTAVADWIERTRVTRDREGKDYDRTAFTQLFQKRGERTVGGGTKTTGATQTQWNGTPFGTPLSLRITVRPRVAGEGFLTSSNQRVSGDSKVGKFGHFLDVELLTVNGTRPQLTETQRAQLEKWITLSDSEGRIARVRNMGEKFRTGSLSDDAATRPPAPAREPVSADVDQLLRKAFPNMDAGRWFREGRYLVEPPDPKLGKYAVGFRIDLAAQPITVESIGPKHDRQIANAIKQRLTKFVKQHPELIRAFAEPSAGTTLEGTRHEVAPGDSPQGPGAAVAGQEPGGGQAPGAAVGRREAVHPDIVADAPETDVEALDSLTAEAVAGGYQGDPAALRADLEERLQVMRDLDAEMDASGRNPLVLLREIARLGGLSIKAETRSGRANGGLAGELKWLKEFQDNVGTTLRPRTAFGLVRGVRGVFSEKEGRSFDDMLAGLQQDPRFNYIQSFDDLMEEIRAAATAEQPGELRARFRASLVASREDWWTPIVEALERRTAAATPVDDAVDAGDGDVSFDVNEFGEAQDRLPGAADARQVGQATTTFRAPTQASDDTFARAFLQENVEPAATTGGLFDEPPDREPAPAKPAPPVKPKKSGGGGASAMRLPGDIQGGGGGMVALPPSPVAAAAPGGPLSPVRPAKQIPALPVAEIVQQLSDLFEGMTVGVGRFNEKALGIYKGEPIGKGAPQTVRTRVAEDLQVLAHEFGHHLDMAIMLGSATHKRGPVAEELKKVGASTSMPSYSAKQKRREGAAEFFRRWLMEPDTLPQLAPLYLAEFNKFLDANTALAQGLEKIRANVRAYLQLSGAEQAKLHIDYTGGSRGPLAVAQRIATAARTPESRRDAIAYLSSQWADDLAVLNLAERDLMGDRPIPITESAYVQARLARGAAGKAEGFLTYGVRADDGTFMGRSFDDAIGPVIHRLEDFSLYAAVRRAQILHKRGKASGFTDAQIADTVRRLQSPAFDQALAHLQEFNDAKLDYMVEGGALAPEQKAAIKKLNPIYVPFQRVRDAATSSLTGRKVANLGVPVKRLKGSGRRIIDPLEMIIRNTHQEVANVEQNKAMGRLVKLALKTDKHGDWLEEIPAPKVATRFNLQALRKEIREVLEEMDVELPAGGLTLDEYLDTAVTVYTPQQFVTPNGDRIVTWNERGKRRWFQVNDPGLYDAITAIGPTNTAEVVKLFYRGARVLRGFATATVGFVQRNPLRDQGVAAVQTRAGYRPFVDFTRGLFQYLGAGERYQQWLNSGGSQAALQAQDRDYLRERLRELGHSGRRKLLDRLVLHPIDGLRALSEAFETATRLGEFMRTIDKARGVDADVLQQAALNSRDVTQDFSVAGRQVRAWNNYTAFFSARVGGYVRLWQAFTEKGEGWGNGGGRGGPPPIDLKADGAGGWHFPKPTHVWLRALTAITLPSILMWILHRDDEEYQERPQWERDYFWHVPLPTGGYVILPKPFELGQMFGTTVEHVLDWLYKDNPQQLLETLAVDKREALQLLQQVVPTALMPWIQVAANYDFFRDRQIVSPWLEDLAPELQYNRWTSESAKRIGKALGVSPAKIESLVYGYTAGVGQGTLSAGDALLGSGKPAGGPSRWIGVGGLYRTYATSEAESLTEFYEARDTLAGLRGSVKVWQEQGDRERAQREVEKYQHLVPRYEQIQRADRQLQGKRGAINAIFESTKMTPQQKRQALDGLYLEMVNIARGALGKPQLQRPSPPVAAR